MFGSIFKPSFIKDLFVHIQSKIRPMLLEKKLFIDTLLLKHFLEVTMNVKRYLAAVIGLFIFIFLYEFLVHGVLLMNMYQATSTVWRNLAEMQANMPLAMGFQLAFSAWTAFVFTQLYKDGGLKNGLLFGLYFGVFAGILTASWYLHLPVPAVLGWSWFASGIVEGLGAGAVLGLIYHE